MNKDSAYQQLRSHLAYLNWRLLPRRSPPTWNGHDTTVRVIPSSSRSCCGWRWKPPNTADGQPG